MFELDKLDWKILNELSLNSRQSFRQLAKKIGTSISTVSKRVEKLQKEGIIKSFTVEVDLDKIGYDLVAIIDITVKNGRSLDVAKQVENHKNVCSIYDITGLTDEIIIAKFKNRAELTKLVKHIQELEDVERTNTRLVLGTIKEKNSWLPNKIVSQTQLF